MDYDNKIKSDETVIELEKVSKKYKKNEALKKCSLSIKKGGIYGIVGKNGAGKTTLLKIMLSLVRPSEGTVEIHTAPGKCKYGAIINAPAVDPDMTAFQNIKYAALLSGKADITRINKVLRQTGLENTGKKKVGCFSLGMKQRLGIAMAIYAEPQILILDEPLNGLDPEGIIDIRNLLRQLNYDLQTTILISSHILAELDKLATDYIFIKDGSVIYEETRDNIEKIMKKKKIDNFEDFYMEINHEKSVES